jgi:serine/threonine kinase 32
LEENPLKARKRKEGQDVDTMTPEMRMMEEQYVVEVDVIWEVI